MADPVRTLPEADARARLLHSALEVFGTYNLEGATTRALAGRAGVNQAAIPYYFGGKEGLYLACIQELFTARATRIRPIVGEIQAWLATKPTDRQAALALIKKLLGTMLEMLLSDDACKTWGRIIMREQMQPTKAFDIVYEGIIRRVHETFTALLAIVLGREPTDRSVVFRVHMLVGQVLIFLSGRETIRRRLDLTAYTPEEIREIQAALNEQLDLLNTKEVKK